MLLLAGGATAQDTAPRVLVIELANDINPVTADYVIDGIERAEEEGYDAVVLELDTPGGLDTAMRDIIDAWFAAHVRESPTG